MAKKQVVETAEAPKNKGGRPRKKPAPVVNEETEMVTMAQKNKQQFHPDEVGKVVESKKPMPDKVTTAALQTRWKAMLGAYGQKASFDEIIRSWNNNMGMNKNPFLQNRRVKEIITPSRRFNKEELNNAVADPENHEYDLRAITWYIYYTQYIFQNIIKLNRDVPKYNYYYNPLYLENTKDKDGIRKESIFVDKALKAFSPKLTFKTIATQVAVEGKCTYLTRISYNKDDVNFFVLQKLNSDQVKITSLGSRQKFLVCFNFAIFLRAGYSPEQYPKYIQDIWQQLITDGIVIEDKRGRKRINPKANIPPEYILEKGLGENWMFWVPLPQDATITFYSDGAHSNAFGDMIGLLEPFSTLQDYSWLAGNLLSRGINSILTAEVPLVKDNKAGADMTSISPDTILGYTDMFNNMVSENVTGFFAPFTDFKLHSLDSQPEAMEIVQNRIKELVSSAGQTGLITLSDKPPIAAIKTAQKLQAAKGDYLTRQFEDWMNYTLNSSFGLKNQWQVSFFGDIFTDEETITGVKEMVIQGAKGLIPKLMAYHGMTMEDYRGAENFIDIFGIEIKSNAQALAERTADDNLALGKAQIKQKATTTSTSTTSTSSEKSVGRPAISEPENDNTDASKSEGSNVSENK